jgi:Family of unknown function (DUF5677)
MMLDHPDATTAPAWCAHGAASLALTPGQSGGSAAIGEKTFWNVPSDERTSATRRTLAVEIVEAQIPDVARVAVTPDKLASFTSEEDFTGLSVDLLVEVGAFVCIAASLLPGDTKRWTRDQAIVAGNIVRLYKLISALLDQTCQKRRETTFIFARLAFETIVNVQYLVKFATPDLFASYIRYSLRHEKRLHDRIRANIAARGGEELPIERRMLASIDRTARTSGVSLSEVSATGGKNWGGKNLFERATAVGLETAYLAAFGGGSHSVHGNWMDLLEYHIDSVDDGFGPQLEWRRPRPQVCFATALMATETMGCYFEYVCGEEVSPLLVERLTDVAERILLAGQAYEKFLSSGAP